MMVLGRHVVEEPIMPLFYPVGIATIQPQNILFQRLQKEFNHTLISQMGQTPLMCMGNSTCSLMTGIMVVVVL